MYNHQLDTFIKVAELGSLSKAAEAQYVSPSAVLQQIKSLENKLDTKLLVRTQHGTKLTPTGEILYHEASKMIAISNEIRRQISALEQSENDEIHFGASPIEHSHLFYKWWNLFAAENPNCRVKFKPISSIGDRKEWDNVDIMEGVYVGDLTNEKFDFLTLANYPIAHAVWKDHPLAQNKTLRYEDMRGQTLITLSGNYLIGQIKDLRSQAEKHGINLITTEYYDISTFSTCVSNGYIIQLPLSEQYDQPDMITIPCDWDYTVPYGLYYRKDASPIIKKFISYISKNLDNKTAP